VLALLDEHGDEAKLLAGGQSLLPLLNFRLARPAVIVDLSLVPDLSATERVDGWIRVGAMARQREVELSPLFAEDCPLVPMAIRHIGHFQIRNRGTIGGSLAHADPAAELPAVALALGAEFEARSTQGPRTIAAEEFFDGPFTTALRPDEVLLEVRFPVSRGRRVAFAELARRRGDFAMAGVAVALGLEAGSRRVTSVALACLGLGPNAVRLRAAEMELEGKDLGPETMARAAGAASAEVSPFTDLHADEEYRRHVAGVLVTRVLVEAAA
jgi:carbon-monoxide dehydrogenase medium subunit